MDRAASAAHGPANWLDGSLDGVRYRKRAQENRDDRRIPFPGESVLARKQCPSSNFWKSVPYFNRCSSSVPRSSSATSKHTSATRGSKRHGRNTKHGSRLWAVLSGAPPEDVKASYPKATILKGSRVVFNIKGNDYRLIASVQYQAGVLAIRFFGTHAEYDKIDAEIV